MAITIDWGTKVIYVPRADMPVVQVSPEIRELDVNAFRLELKELEAGMEGMVYPDTHRHNTEVTVGGLTFARVVEIINGYTITFEDGSYGVNLVGANNNILDVVNFNQVSVRSSNSAGLVTSREIIEMHKLQGLVAANPLNVSDTARSAGDISQTIVENPDGSVTVTRI